MSPRDPSDPSNPSGPTEPTDPNGARRQVVWRTDDGAGLERLVLAPAGDGFVATSTFVAVDAEVRATIAIDRGWRATRVELVAGDARLVLDRPSPAAWRVDGRPDLRLAGCDDVDLQWSAFTNTLSLRRLALPIGGDATVDVVYVRAGPLSPARIERARHRYTRVAATTWRFATEDGSFTALIDVDDDGLVVRYPGVATRVAAR